MSDIKIFDIHVDTKDIRTTVLPILVEIKPEWKGAEICSEQFSQGFVNFMTCFYAKGDEHRKVMKLQSTVFVLPYVFCS